MKVPKDLRGVIGKELIRYSLKTSDCREAVRKVRLEASKWDAVFQLEREKLRKTDVQKGVRSELTESEMHQLVYRFFVELERKSEDWWNTKGRYLDPSETQEVLETLHIETEVYAGGSPHYREEEGDPNSAVTRILKEEGIEVSRTDHSFKKLVGLFRSACLENTIRDVERLSRQSIKGTEPLFRNVFTNTEVQREKTISIKELIKRYVKALREIGRSEGTLTTYRIPLRILCEEVGENTPISTITTEKIEEIFTLLKTAPPNATKRFRGLTLGEASASVVDNPNERLSSKTLENYYTNISALFNFAVEKRLMKENPAKDKYLRSQFISDDEEDPIHYSIDELNLLFRAPIYTGCVDDGRNYSKVGSALPRRGRFWLPLICLYHGLRCNEAAQLYSEDVCCEEGIHYFFIRESRADGSICDKRIKTPQSKRRVPLHPEIVKIGFLDFVNLRRNDDHPRLFPEILAGKTGYFSNAFSKWFGRFKGKVLGDKCDATFHSFRHHFGTALGEMRVSEGDKRALGGWQTKDQSSALRYDKASLKRLQSIINEVSYPGLDVSHLHTKPLPIHEIL